jgi:hypothetical protein
MKYYLLTLFFISSYSYATQCPPESLLIDYVSPVSGERKQMCAYHDKSGDVVKHGEEIIFDKDNKIVKRINYVHGEQKQFPASLPGADEKTSEKDEVLAAVHEIAEILSLHKKEKPNKRFKINKCDPKPQDWVKAAIFKTPLEREYKFSEECDASGKFKASFETPFDINFQLRNLFDFHKTVQKIQMSVKTNKGIIYRFESKDGWIYAPKRNAMFSLEYEVEVNPSTGEVILGTQKGSIKLHKINDIEINETRKLEFSP